MAGKSTLDPDNIPARRGRKNLKGHDTNSLGPSDTSDSGSDMKGLGERDDNSDSGGTGERLTAGQDPRIRVNQDRDADRVVESDAAGLGGGLDQAEEARLKKQRPPK